ncbi:MarR family winged helix-turn-helix transcriptional regulator [Amycolatopsis sp. 3B14]|uniref:MarR family winged helix-turn-helix transcriptional regulator n=1 Tax=Amycolatopsis sp. 3B14 TaxID=3243600 RepID=UPI003D99C0C1
MSQIVHPATVRRNAALPYDPIARAAELWEERIGPSETMAVATAVMRVQQIIQTSVDAALRPYGLTFARYEALVLLAFSRRTCLPMGLMGQRLQVHPTSVTNIVDRLERDRMVARVPHPTDRRTTLVQLTNYGRQRQQEATASVVAVNFGLAEMGDSQWAQLWKLLAEIRRAAGDFV